MEVGPSVVWQTCLVVFWYSLWVVYWVGRSETVAKSQSTTTICFKRLKCVRGPTPIVFKHFNVSLLCQITSQKEFE